jgi:hypothetical protein
VPVEVTRGAVEAWTASVEVTRGTVEAWTASVEVTRGTVEAWTASVEVTRGTVEATTAPVEVKGGTVGSRGGTPLTTRGPDRDQSESNATTVCSPNPAIAPRTGSNNVSAVPTTATSKSSVAIRAVTAAFASSSFTALTFSTYAE